jgi:hypothetical protein
MKTYNFLLISSTNSLRNQYCKPFLSRYLFQQRTYLESAAAGGSDSSDDKLSDDKKWLSVHLGDEKDVSNAKMRKRIDDAEQWEQRKLSDDDSKTLNRLLGIEKEMYELDNELDSPSSSSKANKNNREKRLNTIKSLQKVTSSSRNTELKGFLGQYMNFLY